MIKSSIERLSDIIGFEIGTSDDETQSKLLNGFAKGLANSIREKDNYENQCCFIADKLDPTAEKVLSDIVEFIKIKNERLKENERPRI